MIAINFMSSKDNDEERSKSDNIEFMIYDNADEAVEKPFESLVNRYQIGLETPMRGSDFIFDWVYLFYYKCHKTNPNRGGSCADSTDCIKTKKATINPINKKDNKYF